MKHFLRYILLILIIGITASCSSNRKMVRTDDIQAFTAHCNIKVIESNNTTNLEGSLRFRKDDVIQILFTPIFGIEAARLEISPDNVLLIDRMNKQFIQASYREIREMSDIDLSYKKIQKLFLHYLTISNDATLSDQHIAFPLNSHLKMDLRLSNFTMRNDWSGHSTVSDKYRQIEINDLLKLLILH